MVGATEAMMVIAVIEATVPEPNAILRTAAMKNAKKRATSGEDEVFWIALATTSAIPVALMTAPNEPPAPVMSNTTPQLLSASFADASRSDFERDTDETR